MGRLRTPPVPVAPVFPNRPPLAALPLPAVQEVPVFLDLGLQPHLLVQERLVLMALYVQVVDETGQLTVQQSGGVEQPLELIAVSHLRVLQTVLQGS